MKIIIKGDPIAQKRHRHVSQNGFVRVYNPNGNEKKVVAEQMIRQTREMRLKDPNWHPVSPISLRLSIYRARPKNLANSKRNASGWILDMPITKPDFDNYCKFYSDCGNNILWKDDNQIVTAHIKKRYAKPGEEPYTEIEVMEHKPIAEEAKKILTVFDPETFKEFVHDARTFALFGYKEIESLLDQPEISEHLLQSIATDINRFSKKYADKLAKVSKYTYEYERGV